VKGAGLDLIYFRGAESGWISGQVLTVPPRDPFFLLTTDGGAHWRRRNIFDDQRISLVQEFWFDDAKTGGLVIDRVHSSETGGRYERYETMTGGADWMIREVSPAPIRPRAARTAMPDSAWRVREDAKTQSWQVEQRVGAGWKLVAAFALEAAVCVPKEEELSKPEPSEEKTLPQELPTAPGGVFQIPGRRTPRKDKPREEQEKKPPALKKELIGVAPAR
jgi:hypothetical protein